MPVTFDNVSSSGRKTVISYAWSHTCTGSDLLLIVGVGGGQFLSAFFPGVSSITYTKGSSTIGLTKLDTLKATNFETGIELWYMIAPDTGAHDITVTLNEVPSSQSYAGGISVTGAHQSAPFGTVAKVEGATTSGPDTVVVTSAVGELVVDVVSTGGDLFSTDQTERILIDTGSYNSCDNFGMSTAAGAASVTMGYDMTAGDIYELMGVSIKSSAGGTRTAKVTRPKPLGVEHGMNFGVQR